MIITCPSCATQFFVPDDKIGPRGRKVRCARCANEWVQRPEAAPSPDDDDPFATSAYEESAEAGDFELDAEPDDAGPDDADLEDEDDVAELAGRLGIGDEAEDEVEPPARRRTGPGGWIALVVVLAALAGGAYAARQQIVNFWPPSARAFQLAGLPVDEPAMYGLSIQNVAHERAIDSGQPVLLVSGNVVNDATQPKALPRLRVALTDDAGKEIYHWTVTLAKPELGPDETVPFSARLPNPPKAAKSLAVRFTQPLVAQ